MRRLLVPLLCLLAAGFWWASARDAVVALDRCTALSAGTVRAGCFEEALLDADRAGRFADAWSQFSPMVSADPSLHDDCHLAAHRVGSVIVDSAAETVELLRGFPDPVCSWGLGHGVFEGFARLSAAPSEWDRVAAVCRDFLDGGAGVAALCGDGFGHALWDVLPVFPNAVRGCASLGAPVLGEACVGGVMMQLFRPADREGSAPSGSGSTPGEVLVLCAEDAFPSYDWFLRGCLLGAGYVLAQDVVTDPLAGSAPLDKIAASFAGLEEVCVRFASGFGEPGPVEDLCFGSVLTNLPARFNSGSPDRQLLCAALSRPSRCS